MPIDSSRCILCAREDISPGINYSISCPNCGVFRISYEALSDLPGDFSRGQNEQEYVLSGYAREASDSSTDATAQPIQILTSNYKEILQSPLIPRSAIEKMDKLLLHIARRANFIFHSLRVDLSTPAIAYAHDTHELTSLLYGLEEEGFIKLRKFDSLCELTTKGLHRVNGLRGGTGEVSLVNAKSLFDRQQYRSAGTIAGIVLEGHLAQVYANHTVTISKKLPTLSDFYDALKSVGLIDTPTWRSMQLLGDIRNLCAHASVREPTIVEVENLIKETGRILTSIT